MAVVCTVFVYGNAASCKRARLLLENLPQVKRIDADAAGFEIKMLLEESIREKSLIPLLAQSGISGFRLD